DGRSSAAALLEEPRPVEVRVEETLTDRGPPLAALHSLLSRKRRSGRSAVPRRPTGTGRRRVVLSRRILLGSAARPLTRLFSPRLLEQLRLQGEVRQPGNGRLQVCQRCLRHDAVGLARDAQDQQPFVLQQLAELLLELRFLAVCRFLVLRDCDNLS